MTDAPGESDDDHFSYGTWTDDNRSDQVQADDEQAKEIALQVRAPGAGGWLWGFLSAFLDGGMGDAGERPRVVAVNGLGWEYIIRHYGSTKEAFRGLEVLDLELNELGSAAFAERYGLADFFEMDPDERPPG